jgi:hypothetical protein
VKISYSAKVCKQPVNACLSPYSTIPWSFNGIYFGSPKFPLGTYLRYILFDDGVISEEYLVVVVGFYPSLETKQWNYFLYSFQFHRVLDDCGGFPEFSHFGDGCYSKLEPLD